MSVNTNGTPQTMIEDQAAEIERLKVKIDKLEKKLQHVEANSMIRRKRIAELEGKLNRQLEIYHKQRESMDKESDLIEKLQARIDEMERQNKQRKSINAQMLMAAAESGNPNYQATIENLQTQLTERDDCIWGLWQVLDKYSEPECTLKDLGTFGPDRRELIEKIVEEK